jgi:hypothetical protein
MSRTLIRVNVSSKELEAVILRPDGSQISSRLVKLGKTRWLRPNP